MAKTIITNTKQQEIRNRMIFVKKVKRFAKSKAGLKILNQLAPEIAKKITEHPEWLDIEQYYNDPRVCGNYRIDFYDSLLYTGESGNCLLRISEHIFNYCAGADAFGHKYEPSVPGKFEVFAWGVCHKEMRELIESRVIEKMHPLLQWTDPEDPAYGSDKPIPDDGETTRETLRPDICVHTNLKIERFHAVQNAYNKEHHK